MFCTKCGKELKEGYIFCTACGNPVKGQKSPTNLKMPKQKKRRHGIEILAGILVSIVVMSGGFILYEAFFKGGSGETLSVKTEISPQPEVTDKETEADSELEEKGSEHALVQDNTEDQMEKRGSGEGEKNSRRIEDQCFEVSLTPLGEISFISYAPEQEDEDVVFSIEKDGKELLTLAHNKADSYRFYDVEEVFFDDYNGDGVDDIMTNCSYRDINSMTDDSFMVCSVYRGSAEGRFYYQSTLSDIGTLRAGEKKSIYYFKEELMKCYQTEDLPYSDSHNWSKEDLEMLTPEQLRFARNEIYARHGYSFNDEELLQHFGARDWYEPAKTEVLETELNQYEIFNRDLILELEGKE